MKNIVCWLLLTIPMISQTSIASAHSMQNGLREEGIWLGTLGGHRIMACFEMPIEIGDLNRSSYFYLRYSKAIALRQNINTINSWQEGDTDKSTGTWLIESVTGNRLEGTWQDPLTAKRLPIKLQRFEDLSGAPNGCLGEDSVHKPQLHQKIYAAKVLRSEILHLSGKAYRNLSLENMNVDSLELIEEMPGRKAINFVLENQLRSNAINYLSCPVRGEDEHSIEGDSKATDYKANADIVFWNSTWLSIVSRTSGDCGGAYPFWGFEYSTWDTETGKRVNLWSWIKSRKKQVIDDRFDDYYFGDQARHDLNSLIVNMALKARRKLNGSRPEERESCLSELRENSRYQVHLSKTGIVFSQDFPHAWQACNDDVDISFRRLMPYLTVQGKSAVRSLMR